MIDTGTVCDRIISVRRKRGPTEQLDVLGGWWGPRVWGGGEELQDFVIFNSRTERRGCLRCITKFWL